MKAHHTAWLQRLWPRQFVVQVTLLTAALITLGISTLALYGTAEFLKQQHTGAEEQLTAVADNLAFGSAHLLLVRDSAALEQLLLKAASYPRLRSLVISDTSNHVLSEVQHKAGQPAEAIFKYDVVLPPHGNDTKFVWRYGNQDHSAPFAFGLDATQLEIWHPIEGGTLGWLHITTSVDDIRTEALLRIKESMLFSLLVVVLTTLGLIWLLRPSLQAISSATDFARGLTQAHGQQIPVFSRSIELHQLCNALNEASAQLYNQKNALKDSSERLQAIFGNVIEGIVTWGLDGNIESANMAAHQIFGYDNLSLIGKSIYSIMPFLDAATTASSSTEGEQSFLSTQQEGTGLRLDGTQPFLGIAISTFTLNNALHYIGAIRDITTRKEAEQELHESEQRFRYMLETCPTAARIARSGGHDVIFYNSRYAELINASPTQVQGVNPAKYYANPEEYADIVARIQRGEQIIDRLVELNIPGEGTKWALASYLTLQYQGDSAVLGWFHDITDSKLNEAAIRDQAEHTQAILDNMIDGIITIDQTGLIASFSPAAERIFGYTPVEVLGHNVKMLMPNPHHDAHDSYLRNYQATGIARIIGIGREVEGQRKDGSLFPMELAISEISRQGRVMYIGMVRDITERKHVERMKIEFVSTVSHELRTPLTSISGALGLIVGGALGEIPAQAGQMIAIAYKNSQRLTYLINDLLDMEKLVAGKMHFDIQPQPLMPLIEQALEANRNYGTERRVTLTLTGSAPDTEVRVDSQRLMQVMSNLLSNAIKFSPEGDTVEIAVATYGRSLRVTITDHGSGIPATFHSRIFQKFAQADSSDTRQKGGTGLGLAITRELVERMGGNISFESEEGQGARFYFEFPIINTHGYKPLIEQPPVTAVAPRILIVEDEPDIAHLLSLMLTRAGYAVDTAGSGAEALAALQQSSYSAMTLDLMLPDISGLEIIRQLRQRPETAELPIIVVSAKMDEGRLAINGDFSGIDWLAKPINEASLLFAVGKHLPEKSGHRPRILHVEDDADLHQVIRATVGERFDFELETSLHDARIRLALERFDLIILDLSLPDGSGWDLLPEIRARQPDARVVILSGAEMTLEETRKVEAVLLKSQASPRELLDALNNYVPPRKN